MRQRPPAVAGEFILHPVSLGALLLLGCNDHFLKHAYPSWLTGKLSDVAGMIFFPLFLLGVWEWSRALRALPLQRSEKALWTSLGSTALVFTAINISPVCGELFLRILAWLYASVGRSAQHVVDPSDLLALPGLALPHVIYLRARPASGYRTQSSDCSKTPTAPLSIQSSSVSNS